MPKNKKNSTAAIQAVCAIIFIVFVFSYLFFLQADILALSQCAWSGGQTHYNAWVGSILLTLAFFLIRLGVASLVKFPRRLQSLTYFPSFVMLGALTSGVMQEDGNVTLGLSTWVAAAFLVLFVLVAKQLSTLRPYETPLKSTSLLSQASWMNVGLMLVMMLLCCAMGNTDRLLHHRLKMERYVSQRQYSKVLLVADNERETDHAQTMFRAFSLSKKQLLGEKLFTYPVKGGSRALLPDTALDSRFAFTTDSLLWKHLGAVPSFHVDDVSDYLLLLQRKHKAKPAVDDYLLTAYLLDGDLDSFARSIGLYYDMRTDEERAAAHEALEKKRKALARKFGDDAAADSVKEVLLTPSGYVRKQQADIPKHFREALVLYTHLRGNRVLTYKDNVLDADYEDFLKVNRRKYPSNAARESALRDAYFGTYWYYYEMQICK